MKKKVLILLILLILGLVVLVRAMDFTPQGNMNLRGIYNISGAPEINATMYYGNGSQLTGISTIFDGTWINFTDGGYMYDNGTTLILGHS